MTGKRVFLLAVAAWMATGCTTVSIVDAAQVAMTEAQAGLRGAAIDFADFLYARGWCADPSASMAGLLLNGRAAPEDPSIAYLQSKDIGERPALIVAQAVAQDASEAARGAGDVNTAAAAALSEKVAAGASSAAEDLRAMERAVISAKRARQLFAGAADRLRLHLTEGDEHLLDSPITRFDGEIAKMAGYADQLAHRSRAAMSAGEGR